MKRSILLAVSAPMLMVLAGCSGGDIPEQTLVLENHKFTPDQIDIPHGQKVKIKVENRDDAYEEFDSDSLGREKVIPGKSSGVVVIGPLETGKYPFMGEYHHETAQGLVVVQ